MAYVVNPLCPDGSSARAAPAASSRNMSPEIGDTDMLDPIVRAAAHPSRAILDAPAPRYRLSEIGNVTANGRLAFSGDAAVVGGASGSPFPDPLGASPVIYAPFVCYLFANDP